MQGKITEKTRFNYPAIRSPSYYDSPDVPTVEDDPATCCEVKQFCEPFIDCGQITLASIAVFICTPCIATCCAYFGLGMAKNEITKPAENL